ncbi:MAG: pyruvate dehydrogenase complex dihydrolipoamide acetyltransferase [Alphaproteobacteria bacterium]|nr:pyruvate dehydrogenase complex dihydrolipoamide acetyltransferase [Alphaproteobacteria bacterium]
MPVDILMPALSPTMTEGNLARWLKQEGDEVKAGQVIAEIETDKATMEVEAVDEGKLGKILIAAGTQGIKVNTPIAVLLEDGESAADIKGGSAAKPQAAAAKPEAPKAQMQAAPQQVATPSRNGSDGGRVFASPLARRVAEQSGVDLKSIAGTGPNGRIVRADVEGAAKTGGQRAAGPASAPAASPGPTSSIDARDLADKLGMPYEAIPNNGVRKVIARRLLEAKQTIPHFYLTVDCVIDELLALRKKLNSVEGVKVSVNDLIIRGVALALRQVPAANASWMDEAIIKYKNCDVSVAVATDNGLITPIIKNADTKTVAQISTEMKDLAVRARDNKLRPEEFQGGGFTISNLGMFGVKEFSAIINPPQSCILAVGAGEQRPVVRDGQIVVANVMTCTLSVDHRSVDGSVGAEFLAAFKKLIEQAYSLVV